MDITPKKYLLLDSRVIRHSKNCKLTLGKVTKSKYNPLFTEDKLWEPRFDNLYANIIFDTINNQAYYRCWYSPFIIDYATTKTENKNKKPGSYIKRLHEMKVKYGSKKIRAMGICYTISKDGINWEKPSLHIVEFNDSKENNIVLRNNHGAGLFKDDCTEEINERYKLILADDNERKMFIYTSSDGLKWSKPQACPNIAKVSEETKNLSIKWNGDTHNNVIWAPTIEKYVLITRMWKLAKDNNGKNIGIRIVGRSESTDYKTWTPTEPIFEGKDIYLQIYSMPIFEYYGIYLGLPAIFNIKTDTVQTELAWSPDTIKWYRICPGAALIPNSETKGDIDWGCIYSAKSPIILYNEIRLYYSGSDGPHTDWRKGYFCLATMRSDGFAGYKPIDDTLESSIITIPIPWTGNDLGLSADIYDGGYVKVTVLNENDNILGNSVIEKTSMDEKLKITTKDPNSISLNIEVKFKFYLKNAILYSFSF
jgi:hypothetical protein